MGKTATTNQQRFQGEMRNQATTQQRLFNNPQNSLAESARPFVCVCLSYVRLAVSQGIGNLVLCQSVES